MSELSAVSDTLYVPLLGRIYASKYHPDILYDEAPLQIYDKLDSRIREMPGQTEYSSLASAVRSKNMDHDVQGFLSRFPAGVIVNLGCGLETIFHRNDNGIAIWYELDLPEVLELRNGYFPETERDRYLPYSMFDYEWMDAVREAAQTPVMVIASGLFLYFLEEQVVDLLRHLAGFPNAEIVFDTLSPAGLKVARRYIKRMGKQEARVYFYVDNAGAFAAKLPDDTEVIEERKLYSLVDYRYNMAFDTRLRMAVSDAFNMVKIIHLRLSKTNIE